MAFIVRLRKHKAVFPIKIRRVLLAIPLKVCYTSLDFRKYGHSDGAANGFGAIFLKL